MSISNQIKNIAIVGAAGNCGKFITSSLLATGKHTLTALTRLDTKSTFPSGITVKKLDYNNHESIVEALRGQDALVITLPGQGPKETQSQLINAAAEAGVSWILPNDWSPDTANESLVEDINMFKRKVATRKMIEEMGKSSYISVTTGFWYEWSLAIPPAFGFDIQNRKVTFFDEGETRMSISTWPQVGRAVAAILSLPIKSEGGEACLDQLKNKVVYVNSFTLNQKEMLESVLRVTGTKESEWTITKEEAKERYETGLKEVGEGIMIGFVKMLYTRVFYDDGSGDFENNKGTLNKVLGLPKEDLDEATKVAVERSKGPAWGSR